MPPRALYALMLVVVANVLAAVRNPEKEGKQKLHHSRASSAPMKTCGTCGHQSRREELLRDGASATVARAMRSCTDDDPRPKCLPQRHALAALILDRWQKPGGLFSAAAAANKSYHARMPFPHGYFDRVLPLPALHEVHRDFPDNITLRGMGSMNKKGGYLKVSNPSEWKMGLGLQAVMAAMKAPEFLRFLERLTGISPLLADPTNEGGGMHQISTGGSLQIHAECA